MSEENKAGEPTPDGSNQEGEKFVSRKAYEEVSKDMHKYKSKIKDFEAQLNELQAEKKAKEEEAMIEQNRYKDLWENTKAEKDALHNQIVEQKRSISNIAKKNALRQELGSVKEQYLNFADLDSIQIDDTGNIMKESLDAVANKFRHEHSELLPKSPQSNIANLHSPQGGTPKSEPKALADMSVAEMQEMLAKLKTN